MNMKRFLMAALMVGGFSLAMHGQIVLLEEDESTVEQVMPQQTVAPSAPVQTQPAQSGFSLVDEEEEAARQEAARLEAERKAAEEAAAAEAARLEAERKAAEEAAAAEAARLEEERKAAEEAAAEEAARAEAEKQEAERLAAEEAARAEAEKQEAERLAAEEAARAEAERQEAERLAAEEAARLEEERKAAEAAVVVAAPVPVPVYDTQSTPSQNTDAANTSVQDAPADENRDKAIDAALEAQKAALKAAEDARAAAAKADSLLKLQREQEMQLRMLEAQRQAEIEARAKAEAELMERSRQEAEMRARAKAEAEYRAQLEAERRANAYYGDGGANGEEQNENIFKRFYRRNGVNQFTLLSAGYTTYFYLPNSGHKAAEYAGKRHLLALEIFEWRAKCFGMQMFNFEIGLNSITKGQLFEHGNAEKNGFETTSVAKEMWFAYKPAMKFYIPCTTWMAVELYGGLEVDMTAVWSKVNKKYYEACPDVPEQNFFFAPFGGLGVVFYPVHAIPIEVKAEYRHPMQLKGRGNMNIIPQGVYLTAQIQLATRTKKR